jgi:glycerophosphoryl diester phosphodiesterase
MKRVLSHGSVVAHRGCWSLFHPENSWTALKRAEDNGCAIEIDVHLMKDGNIAVFHDFTLNRMCMRKGRLEELTREVREHNNFAKRMPVVEEQIKIINHRINNLEKNK